MSEEQTDHQDHTEVVEEEVLAAEGPSAVAAAAEQETALAPEVALSDIDKPNQEMEKLRQEAKNLRQLVEESADKAVRAQAEVDNLRKRTVREIEKERKRALEKFVKDLLPVIDSMERGIHASESTEDMASLREGMGLTLKMFLDTLDKFGIKAVDPQGEKFNPEKHEAVSMREVEGTEAGLVVEVIQKGYELNGRLIRPAMVMVSK